MAFFWSRVGLPGLALAEALGGAAHALGGRGHGLLAGGVLLFAHLLIELLALVGQFVLLFGLLGHGLLGLLGQEALQLGDLVLFGFELLQGLVLVLHGLVAVLGLEVLGGVLHVPRGLVEVAGLGLLTAGPAGGGTGRRLAVG